MNEARDAERRSARSGRNGDSSSGGEARPDYGSYEDIRERKTSWKDILAGILARRAISDIVALATLASLWHIAVQFTSSAHDSPLALAGALALALLIAAVGIVMFVVGRRQDAETGEKYPNTTPQSRGKHDRSSATRGSSRRD